MLKLSFELLVLAFLVWLRRGKELVVEFVDEEQSGSHPSVAVRFSECWSEGFARWTVNGVSDLMPSADHFLERGKKRLDEVDVVLDELEAIGNHVCRAERRPVKVYVNGAFD